MAKKTVGTKGTAKSGATSRSNGGLWTNKDGSVSPWYNTWGNNSGRAKQPSTGGGSRGSGGGHNPP